MKRIICIRHGHSTSDVEDRYGGDFDDHLSHLGVEQVDQLGKDMINSGIQVIYSSPLLRAQQTAQALIKRLNVDIVIRPDLKERNRYGIISGMTKADAIQKFPDLSNLVRDRKNTLPGTESDAQASQRMMKEFLSISHSSFNCAAVVWHGGGIRALVRDFLNLGAVTEAGDCCWMELALDINSEKFKLVNSSGVIWQA